MGYSNIKADRRHDADQRRIRELEAQLRRERNHNATQTASVVQTQQQNAQGGHVTIEKTSKGLKAQMLASWLVVIIGIVCAFSGSGLGAPLTVTGIIAVIVTKIQIWWRHG